VRLKLVTFAPERSSTNCTFRDRRRLSKCDASSLGFKVADSERVEGFSTAQNDRLTDPGPRH
jgi:hypothetical protein